MKKINIFLKAILLILAAATALKASALQVAAQEEPAEALPIEGQSAAAPANETSQTAPAEQAQSETTSNQTEQPAPPSQEAQAAIDADINLTAQDLGVAEPTILPDSRFYPAKETWRGIKYFFIFSQIGKTEQKLRYANEKLIEAKKIAEKTNDPEKIGAALKNYGEELKNIGSKAADIKQLAKDNARIDKFLEKFVDNSIKQQKLIDKIEEKIPREALDKIAAARNEALNNFSEVSLAIADGQELEEKFEKAVSEQKGSEFKNFKNLEVLKRVMEKAPEKAKQALQKAQENALKRLRETIENMPAEKKGILKDYVANLPGSEIAQIEIMHEFESENITPETRAMVQEAKQAAIKKVAQAIMGPRSEEKRQAIIENMEGRGMEGVRIISELENGLPQEALDKISVIKDRALDDMRRKIEQADSPEKQDRILNEIKKFHDIKQLEALKEIGRDIAPEKTEFFEKMKDQTMNEMKKDVDSAANETDKKMIFMKMASDNPEGIAAMKEFAPSAEIMQGIMKEQTEKLNQKIETEQNAEKLEMMKRRMEKAGVKAEIELSNPEMFRKIQSRQMMLENKPTKTLPDQKTTPPAKINETNNSKETGKQKTGQPENRGQIKINSSERKNDASGRVEGAQEARPIIQQKIVPKTGTNRAYGLEPQSAKQAQPASETKQGFMEKIGGAILNGIKALFR